MFAKEGYPFIIFFSILTIFLLFASISLDSLLLAVPAVISVILTVFVFYFFRDPERTPPADGKLILAPADGTVIVAECVPETPLGGEALKISIFMSVFNVHVNRVPFSGRVIDKKYFRGCFLDARDGKASFENERSVIVLETAKGVRIAFVQIAGLIARRIVSYPVIGDDLTRGERYGLIRFGSRVDIYLPADLKSEVKPGDLTVSGETVLARFS